jgi:hypothetical protein
MSVFASDRSGPNMQTEIEKRMAVLSDTDIRGVFSYICDRNCRHGKNCRNKISDGISVSDALKKVEDFRKHIWINPEELGNTTDKVQKLSGRDHRTVMLIDNLFQMRNPHTREIEYTIEFNKVKEKVKDKGNRKEMEYMKKDDAINFFVNIEYKI